MPPQDGITYDLRDIHHLNQELVRWLASAPPSAKLGDSHDREVAVVRIGNERCVLRGGNTRAGVTEYLLRTVSGRACFHAVPSTKGVIHRVTVGSDSERVRGFYLYTDRTFPQPTVFAAADGSAFELQDVWLRIMDAVALLHSRGHQRLHVLPVLGDLAPHLNVVLAEGVDYGGSSPSWDGESMVFAYTMAAGPQVGRLRVGPDTPLADIAQEILAGASDRGVGIDWAYAGWYAELVAEAHRLGVIPVASSHFSLPGCPVWRLGFEGYPVWHSDHDGDVPFPPPPVQRGRTGFTDVFPLPPLGDSDVPFTSPPHPSAADVTKRPDFQGLVAQFARTEGPCTGLYALTGEGVYRRQGLTWFRLEPEDHSGLDRRAGFAVTYRFIKAYDHFEYSGGCLDWNLAQRLG